QPPSPLNIDTIKGVLRQYHKDAYMDDMAAVFSMAQSYVERRVAEVNKPAVVLDIDETSLSNWTELDLDDLGFIRNGPCSERRGFACGFRTWVAKGAAPAIRPSREFYNAIRTKGVAVFFI